MAEREYTKLTPMRQRRGFAVISSSRSNLWLGKDHLLCIETEGYTESYKRFYFRDIQAITLRKTVRMLTIGLVTGSFTAFFALITIGVSDEAAKWVFGVLTALCAVPFILNFLYGPTCACQLRTAVQTEDVPSLSRVRRARKVIARVRPLIAEAQGQLNEADIPQLMQDLATGANGPAGRAAMNDPNAPPVIARQSPGPVPEPLRHSRGTPHLVLAWLLLADLPVTLPYFFIEAGWLESVGLVLMLATVAAAIVAIVRQLRTNLPRGLKLLPWITLGSAAISLVVAIGYVFALAISQPGAMSDFSPMNDPVMLVMTMITTTFSVILGALGLIWVRRFRASQAAPSPPPAAGSPAS